MLTPMNESKLATAGKSTLAKLRVCLRPWMLAAGLGLVTIALYWPLIGHDFLDYDDDLYVTANVHVQKGLAWESIQWAFCNPVGANWHPMTMLSHMLDCQLYGLQPWGHHWTSLWLQALDTVLVYVLLWRLTGARWRSACVAALFGWHPLHVESVAWVAERKDVLSTCFGLLALLAYAGYVERGERSGESGRRDGGRRTEGQHPTAIGEHPTSNIQHPTSNGGQGLTSALRPPPSALHPPSSILHPLSSSAYWLSLCCFALGLMSKPMLVTWPGLMLLLDYWPLKRFAICDLRAPFSALRSPLFRRLLIEKLPFFALSVVASVMALVIQHRTGAMKTLESIPLHVRWENALVSYCRYLLKLFWPADLAVFYPYPRHFPLGWVLLAGLLLGGLTVLFWWQRRRYPFCLMGWFWFVGTLVPVIGLVQVGIQAMADRYMYVPSVGLLVVVIWGTHELCRNWRHQVLGLSLAGSAAILLCAATTRQQLGYWQNSETLFLHALAVTADNEVAHNNLGIAYFKKNQTNAAISEFQTALRLKPDCVEAHNNLGNVLIQRGDTDDAIAQYREAIRLDPDLAVAYDNLGTSLILKGQTNAASLQFQEAIRRDPDYVDARYNFAVLLAAQGQTNESIRQFQELLNLSPGDASAGYKLANMLVQSGHPDLAISQLQAGLRRAPGDAEMHFRLGNLLAKQGQPDQAISQFQQAAGLRADFPEARNNLGDLLAKQGRTEEATAQFQAALQLKPDYPDAHYNLGHAFLKQGRMDEAISQFQAVNRLSPEFAPAHYYLGIVLAKKGRADEAMTQFQETLRLKPDDAIAHDKLGIVLGDHGRLDEAISQFQAALRLKPNFAEASNNLARALAVKGAPFSR